MEINFLDYSHELSRLDDEFDGFALGRVSHWFDDSVDKKELLEEALELITSLVDDYKGSYMRGYDDGFYDATEKLTNRDEF